jgi:hypothetical protein
MVTILRITGASPEGAKTRMLFNIPWKNAAREIKARNGNIRRVRNTVSSKASIPKKGTIRGVTTTPIITARVTKKERKVKIAERNILVFSRSASRRYTLKVGIKATAMEPSAKSRRNRLGIRKATEKASDRALVPRRLAFVISRRSPKTRETRVRRDRAEP